MNDSILIIEDEIGLIKMLKRLLDREGFQEVYQATSGVEALKKIKEYKVDLILLDVMLPDANGFDLCQQLREVSEAPIIFLTARTTDIDKLTGFSMGGDDYITKPFNPLEVVARIKAILYRQRRTIPEMSQAFRTDRFVLHYDRARLIVDGKEINCPAKEFQLLKFFCQHPNQVFSVDHLYEKVWGDFNVVGKENTVMVHIRRLRLKIERDLKNPEFLKNVRGLGYMLDYEDQRSFQ